MGRLLVLLLFINIALLAFALIDCLSSDSDEIRSLPKAAWVLIILVFPAIGPGIWFASGRPLAPEDSAGGTGRTTGPRTAASRSPKTQRPIGPDDDPEFLRGISSSLHQNDEERLRAWEDDLHRRERELRQHTDGKPPIAGHDEEAPGDAPR